MYPIIIYRILHPLLTECLILKLIQPSLAVQYLTLPGLSDDYLPVLTQPSPLPNQACQMITYPYLPNRLPYLTTPVR